MATFYVRMHEGDTKAENATVRDGVVVYSFASVRGRHEEFETGNLVGLTETELAARGFRQVKQPVVWTWDTAVTGSGPIDRNGQWSA